jgi:hypothetical protein
LPPASAVKAIEACTVDGRVVSRITPVQSGGENSPGNTARALTPISGKSTKVPKNTIACSRQCEAPASTACGESRAPCMKNISAMATLVAAPTAAAASPVAGISVANPTVAPSAPRNGSTREPTARNLMSASLG